MFSSRPSAPLIVTARISGFRRAPLQASHGLSDWKRLKSSRTQAESTASLAKQGGEAVNQAIEAMVLIKKSSEQVSDIIQVISEIASQTNLLALNAAIEKLNTLQKEADALRGGRLHGSCHWPGTDDAGSRRDDSQYGGGLHQ